MRAEQKRGTASASSRALALARSELGLVSILLMAVAGIAIAGYLTAVHYAQVPLACPTTGILNCQAVTSSAYSVVPGTSIPITIPGILWFAVSGALAGTALVRVWRGRHELPYLRLAHLLWGAAGLIFVLYLVYAEIVALQRLCEWCTVVHLLTLATFLIALQRWQDMLNGTLSPGAASRPARGAGSRGSSATRQSGQPDARRRSSGRGR